MSRTPFKKISRKISKTSSYQLKCWYLLIKAQIFTIYHVTTMRNYCMIILPRPYKKAGPQAKKNIDKESKKFAKLLDLDEKMNVTQTKMRS